MRVRVATWNLHSCVGTDGRHDPARSLEVLAELDADLIALQEVDWRRSHDETGADQLAYFADQLGMHAVAGPNLRDHDGDYGNGLLSRARPAEIELLDLSRPGLEARGAIDACFDLGRRRLRCLVTHLGLRRGERAAQRRILREHLDRGAACDAELLLGDLNEWWPQRLARHPLTTPGPFETGSLARTFPSRLPLVPLDRILARPRPSRFEVHVVRTPLASRASDHLPVVASVEWAPASFGSRRAASFR